MPTLDIPKTMLAWQKHMPITIPVRVEVPVPAPKGDEILVKIHAAGVCHSDVALKEMKQLPVDFKDRTEKFTFGHEGCGEIVAIGQEVKNFEGGEKVAIMIAPGCKSPDCAECSSGVPQICLDGPRYGGGQDGFFAPFAVVREHAAVKLPAGVSAAAGAVATDACMTAYHAVVGRAQVKKGETILICGLGGLGFNALQIVVNIGARAVVMDQRQIVLDEAMKFGVKGKDVIPPGTKDITAWIRERNLRIDTAIDFVAVPETFKVAVESVRRAGTVVLVGLLSSELLIPSQSVVRRQLSILGSYAGTIFDVEACLDLIAKGVLVPQVIEGSMRDFPTILEDLHHGKIKGRIALIPEGLEKA
ncbi:hypothetical protein LTR10_018352 [Elasticomyces elasticus]|uniref:Enoyl reductase (ER) domain-containing protein n=1 Tax=Exophiala sideris TaxID=1016849 RepID=A0ABR0IZT1_9EURO|nr:hypothetical protein LTR10_018352 [Elasticomyces elasticus]KAK5023205.1 hypothetical protein LTS07_009427 [Exophiala sideris]KAK5028577.1 hypothetical protein LTR13_009028 [Exophiala sideris]KAK5052955.1 hypothetical protein LTR69_009524 [Exophiala sideris]KAK5178695.1 hypothetical protein LTR44_008809 [Eurotiomycetes sp. CCFEE 6388]